MMRPIPFSTAHSLRPARFSTGRKLATDDDMPDVRPPRLRSA
jgi:hypothetical protein